MLIFIKISLSEIKRLYNVEEVSALNKNDLNLMVVTLKSDHHGEACWCWWCQLFISVFRLQ